MENQINPVKPPQSESNGVNPKKKNPFFIGGIIIIIIILVTTGLTVWKYYKEVSDLNNQEFEIMDFSMNKKTKTADITSDWRVYRNEEYRYEIKYPKDWKQSEKEEKITFSKTFINSKGWEDGVHFSIEVFGNSSNISVKEWINIHDPIFVEDSKELHFQKDITIDNCDGIYRKITNSVSGGYQNDAFLQHDNFIYKINMDLRILLPEGEQKQKELYNILDQMLSTLKFIETNDSENYLSSTDVYFSEEKQGKVTFYSPDMKIDENKSIWCGGPVIGSKKYQGNFYLSFEDSKLNIGEMSFIEDSRNDGKLWIKKLNPKNNQDFIVILQYGSCNHNEAKFYGYDFVQEKLVQYKFKKKSGEIWDEIYVGPTDDFLNIFSSKDFSSKVYYNSIKEFETDRWRFNDEENIFEEITY